MNMMRWQTVGPYVPSGNNTGASSPLAEVVSLARRSVPLARIAFLLASALAAADDMAVSVVTVVVVVALDEDVFPQLLVVLACHTRSADARLKRPRNYWRRIKALQRVHCIAFFTSTCTTNRRYVQAR